MKERDIRIRLKNDFPFFAINCLKIRPKEGEIVDFKLNRVQKYIHEKIEAQKKEKGYVRAIIVKGRQQGCSTYVAGRFFWQVIHNKGLRAFILTHRDDATDNLFKMTQRYYQYLPDKIKPFVDRKSAKELSFTLLDSGYKVGTAATGSVGRSDTIQLFHGSEVAFWKSASEIASGIMQAIPRESEIILESTAKEMGNFFHSQWLKAESGESDYIPIFIPFYWQEEYKDVLTEGFSLDEEETEIRDIYGLTNEQMAWRRRKIIELGSLPLFKQEYPLTPTEAFQASCTSGLIKNDLVIKARKDTYSVKYGPIIIGVDPSRNDGSGDRTAIICRQGRVAYDLNVFRTDDTMKIVGIINSMIKTHKPDIICIDVIGLGAGIVDRLRELGYGKIVKAINCGLPAYNKDRYKNLKAEMWDLVREWLEDFPCRIPDDESLHTDLCCVGFSHDSISRVVIESKESLKSKGFDSPDTAEALALTFAFPINSNINTHVKSYTTVENIFR
jgi:hypothetical protein